MLKPSNSEIHLLLLFVLLLQVIHQKQLLLVEGASCNADQQQICLHAVVQKRLSWLTTGGECISKQYVQFTHLCTVYNYLPSIDYCCCALTSSLTSSTTSSEERRKGKKMTRRMKKRTKMTRRRNDGGTSNGSHTTHTNDLVGRVHAGGHDYDVGDHDDDDAFDGDDDDDDDGDDIDDDEDDDDGEIPGAALCCRYHQNWNHFRCLESEDAVRTSLEPTVQPFFDGFIAWDLSVVSLVLGLLSMFVSCLVCCFKFWKCRPSGKGDSTGDTGNDTPGVGDSEFASKTKIDLLDNLDPPPYNKMDSSHLQHNASASSISCSTYALQYRQQPSTRDPKALEPQNFTIQQFLHMFTSAKPSHDSISSTSAATAMTTTTTATNREQDIVMATRSSIGRRSKQFFSEDLDDFCFSDERSSVSCSSDSLRSDATSDTDCDRMNRYSFYRRRLDTRMSPSFQASSSSSSRSRGRPKSGFPRFYGHHRSRQSRDHGSRKFLSNGQIFVDDDERLRFLERILRRQKAELEEEENQPETIQTRPGNGSERSRAED